MATRTKLKWGIGTKQALEQNIKSVDDLVTMAERSQMQMENNNVGGEKAWGDQLNKGKLNPRLASGKPFKQYHFSESCSKEVRNLSVFTSSYDEDTICKGDKCLNVANVYLCLFVCVNLHSQLLLFQRLRAVIVLRPLVFGTN